MLDRFRKVAKACFLITLMLPGLTLPSWVHGDISSSIRKYQKASVSTEMLHRLEKYDHYITYFTSFSYFRPRHRVSDDFIRALILAESGADPTAVSAKNALGLGQILFSTGKLAAKELSTSPVTFDYVGKERLRTLSREDLLDPAVNILLTCYLIAKYNYLFNGRLDLVVSAWNAGEHTPSLAQGRHAPYEETKELIGKVNGYYLYLLRQKGLLH